MADQVAGSAGAGEGSADAPKSRGAHPLRRHAMTLLKIIIAVLGVWFVIHTVDWYDTATLKSNGRELATVTFREDVKVRVLSQSAVREGMTLYQIEFPNRPIKASIETRDGRRDVDLTVSDDTVIPGTNEHLGIRKTMEVDQELLKQVKGSYVQLGLHTLLIGASGRWYLLAGAWALLGIPFMVTAIRWRNLMRPQGIEMPLGKCLQLTFVGQFYSIMLPGITGGDLVKIVYAARLTGSKTKSFITIILDRVVGLTALMVIAGASAAIQLMLNAHQYGKPVEGDQTLRNVLLFIVAGLGGMGLFCVVYFSRRLRTMTRLQWLIDHPKVPEFVKHADEVLHAYRGHFGLLTWAFIISLISQLTLPVSAWLSGMAFGMTAPLGYYLAYVPVAILAASLPISPPQGLGFLEYVLYHFFVARGAATASQAVALTQAVRFLPIVWNLFGAYWVITGSYSRHQAQAEEAELEISKNN